MKFSFFSEKAPSPLISTVSAGDMGRNHACQNENRRRLLSDNNIASLTTLRQEHTRVVYDTGELDNGSGSNIGDGLITSEKKAIAVTVADCIPVFLFDPVSGVYGVLHSGWKGTGIVINALEKMKKLYGVKPENIEAITGPSIGKCCYSVSRDRYLEFSSEWGEDSVCIENGKYYLDLKNANRIIMEKAGIRKIYISEACTCCDERFHSYRREGAQEFGLMLALIGYFR